MMENLGTSVPQNLETVRSLVRLGGCSTKYESRLALVVISRRRARIA
jgi:hypothetical protein